MRYIVFLGAVIGALFVAGGLLFSRGAPQEAASAAMGLAFAVIPYVIFRVFQLGESDRRSKQILELMKAAQKPPTQ